VVGAGAVLGGAMTGPLWATGLDIASALVTAGAAVHAAEAVSRDRGSSGGAVAVARAARELSRDPDAPLAADAVEVVCRVRRADPRALRSLAVLVGKATTSHARGVVLQLLGSWLAPMRAFTKATAPYVAARAAMDAADLVRTLADTVAAPVVAAPVTLDEAAPPESGRFPLGTFDAASFDDVIDPTPTLKEAA
jgi:hypothetical protein